MNEALFAGRELSLPEVLDARERRAARQRELLGRHEQTLVSFTMNIAGPVKRFFLADLSFGEGVRRIETQLAARGARVQERKIFCDPEGNEAFFSVPCPPGDVKQWMVRLEEEDAMSRLFDIDVLDQAGRKLDRKETGRPPRRCFLCGRPAAECARSRRHPLGELREYTREVLLGWHLERLSDVIGRTALRALLYEVSVSPKPGLVDRFNNGAHDDMDFFTFLDSGCALLPYFTRCAALGCRCPEAPEESLFPLLRAEGLRAEERMLAASGGVNTHRGAIFSLGLLSAAAGRTSALSESCDEARMFQCASALARCALGDFSGDRKGTPYHRFGMRGARGEAAAGFPHVREGALAALRAGLAGGLSANDAGVTALLRLLAETEDTNVAMRRGPNALPALQREARELLAQSPLDLEAVKRMDQRLIGERISPGGCADLLALAFFAEFLSEELPRLLDRDPAWGSPRV